MQPNGSCSTHRRLIGAREQIISFLSSDTSINDWYQHFKTLTYFLVSYILCFWTRLYHTRSRLAKRLVIVWWSIHSKTGFLLAMLLVIYLLEISIVLMMCRWTYPRRVWPTRYSCWGGSNTTRNITGLLLMLSGLYAWKNNEETISMLINNSVDCLGHHCEMVLNALRSLYTFIL